jgi:putative heme iron utilization protein
MQPVLFQLERCRTNPGPSWPNYHLAPFSRQFAAKRLRRRPLRPYILIFVIKHAFLARPAPGARMETIGLMKTADETPRPGPGQDPSFDPAGESKRLLRTIRTGAVGTLSEEGAPFVTLTAIATDHDGSPILLMSRLALHTRNLERDPRLSLLLAQNGRGDPLAHPRLTLVATAERRADPSLRGRYLRRNPKAALYADFPDFSFWRAEVTNVHLNGGFARAADFGPKGLLTPLDGAESLIAAEEDALAHLNADHAGALALIAQKLGGAAEANWRACSLDPEGLDLIAGDACARIVFPQRVTTPDGLREMLVALAREARSS